jgi:hypothetical protein
MHKTSGKCNVFAFPVIVCKEGIGKGSDRVGQIGSELATGFPCRVTANSLLIERAV